VRETKVNFSEKILMGNFQNTPYCLLGFLMWNVRTGG